MRRIHSEFCFLVYLCFMTKRLIVSLRLGQTVFAVFSRILPCFKEKNKSQIRSSVESTVFNSAAEVLFMNYSQFCMN